MQVVQTILQVQYLIRNRKAGPGWISYLRMGAFHTNMQYNHSRISYFAVNLSLPFLLLVFLLGLMYGSFPKNTGQAVQDRGAHVQQPEQGWMSSALLLSVAY